MLTKFASVLPDRYRVPRTPKAGGTIMRGYNLFGIALGLCVWLSATASAQEILIGLSGPLTGKNSAFGLQMKNGAEQAVADLNADMGGVLYHPLKLQIEDDFCDEIKSRSIAKKFVEGKVAVVIGHYCSSSSISASEEYAAAGVLQITPASTNPTFTDRKMWNTFRVCGRDDEQGNFAAAYIRRNFKSVGIASDNTIYGKGLADEMKKALNLGPGGLREKFYMDYDNDDAMFSPLISKLKHYNVDVLYLGGYHQKAGMILKQMRAKGLKTIMMSGDALADKEFASIAGLDSSEGTLFTFGLDPRNISSAAPIVAKFRAKGIDPEGYTLYTYAAIQVWAAAAVRIGTFEPKRVGDTIRRGIWDTVLGPISFDDKGDIKDNAWAVYKWDRTGNYEEINY
jgi:branched-chain amino acid transport system substrate-binding protein